MPACVNRTAELREAAALRNPRKRVAPPTREVDAFLESARAILASINRLHTFLSKIRKPYLDTRSKPVNSMPTNATHGLQAWENASSLTDRQRDEIDFMVKVQLKRTLEQIKALERAEQARQAMQKNQLPAFARYLGMDNPSSVQQANEQLKAHRSAITLYLNQALTKCSKEQMSQQEIRLQRQLDKSSLSGNLEAYGAKLALKHKAELSSHTKGKAPESIFQPLSNTANDSLRPRARMDDEDDIETQLSPKQIQQFEAEQSELLRQTQSELAQIKKAESSLLEISALQSELVVHLTQQAEITDKLYEDSLFVSGKVGDANVQLKQARERNKESRIWLLVFLIGASLTLLFIDQY